MESNLVSAYMVQLRVNYERRHSLEPVHKRAIVGIPISIIRHAVCARMGKETYEPRARGTPQLVLTINHYPSNEQFSRMYSERGGLRVCYKDQRTTGIMEWPHEWLSTRNKAHATALERLGAYSSE